MGKVPMQRGDRPSSLYLVADQQLATATATYGDRLIPRPCTEHFARYRVDRNG
jgi:hypothetical protein